MFIKIKEEGNAEFKDKSFLMAASKFTEGINIYKKNEETVKSNQELKTKAVQLFTNRSLAMHNMGNSHDAFADADFVLTNLDPENPKALYRRAQGYKSQSKTALAIKDLEKLSKLEPKNAACKKDLVELKTKLKEEEAEAKNKPKIQEVEVTSPSKPSDDDSATKISPKKPLGDKGKIREMLGSETVKNAAASANQAANESVLKSVPKTSAGLEKDFKQLKSDTANAYRYLKQIPLKTLEQIYKKSEVEADTLSGFIGAITEHGLVDDESIKHAAEFFCSLSKASNYDTTLMFINDTEKEKLLEI